jgi:hypothetical protein
MKIYQNEIKKHLGNYAKQRLAVSEEGTFKGRSYAHILPQQLWAKNFLEPYSSTLQDHCSTESIRLHPYIHHLNSSQAFTLIRERSSSVVRNSGECVIFSCERPL